MTEYAQILSYAIPGFVVLIIIEWYFGIKKGVVTNRLFDTISSLSSGITNSLKDVLGLSIVILSYGWFYDKLALQTIETTWIMYLLAFITLDFAGYWSHRLEHQVNIFWNRHIIHHSSEEFNLSCALRQNISAVFAIFTFLLLPAALLGVPPKVVAIVAPLHLFMQFWYHTKLINRMGWLESVIVTPSHHRVHHAINDIYLDKNFGQIFIIWDKLFGTYQEEVASQPPVYGVKRAVNTWNPIAINFQHLTLLVKDAWRTNSIKDKFRIWFMPTGWRPADVDDLYPVASIQDPYSYKKYGLNSHKGLMYWSTFQLIINLVFLIHLLTIIDQFSLTFLLGYGLFIFINIFGYTSLMDHKSHAIFAEILKTILSFYLVITLGSWFGFSSIIPMLYCIICILFTFYFIRTGYGNTEEVLA